MSKGTQQFQVNGKTFRLGQEPVVALCLDGTSDEYLEAALLRDRMPHFKKMILGGFRGLARSALPSFTNVNNVSIVTCLPPSGHGINGNYFLNPDPGINHHGSPIGFRVRDSP